MTIGAGIPASIMVVDDNPENLKLLDGLLHGWGFRQVRAFPRGRLALTSALLEPPDLVLLDINMSEMDGYETCRQFKAAPSLQAVPIIFVSALNEPMDKVNAFGCGGVDYVTKPFQMEEVHARIRTHLQIRHLQKTLETQNRQLQDNYDRLQLLECQRDTLTYMIVHDLRSPLMGISGNLELMSFESKALSEPCRQRLQAASSAASMLIEMISSLLDVSRMESGQMPVQRMPCDLRDLAQNVVAGLRGLLEERAVTVEAQTGDPVVSCDPALLRRILDNLIANAAKFSPRGKPIAIGLQDGPGLLKVTVRDQGSGIPPEYQARIFEKFGQAGAQGGTKRYSTGLGLTFCRLAVEAHGGQIGVESTVGAGSTFWFTLPRRLSGVDLGSGQSFLPTVS
ncbi:MAG: HAMP domain-containing sensor histidine kinase [bacterium]